MSRTGIEAKPAWQSLPIEVRVRVAHVLGSEVVRAARVWGGYSPSPTFRLKLANGQRAFFKASGPGATTFMRHVIEMEERVYTELGAFISPWAPRLLGVVHEAGWRALLLEDVGPKTAPPWTPALTRQVMCAFADYHAATLGADLPDWIARFAETEGKVTWESVVEESEGLERVAALVGPEVDDALRWFRQAEPLFSRLLARAPTIPGPDALMHGDTRSDNLRLQNGQLRLFDWPAVMVGPVEVDLVAFVQSITVEGGPTPERCVEWYGAPLRPDVMDVALVWCIAFFAARVWLPPIDGLPRLRPFQRQQLAVLLDWSARRFQLPAPTWTAAL